MITVLTRVPVAHAIPDSTATAVPSLLVEAREHLGYQYGVDATEQHNDVHAQRAALRKRLEQLDVRPFDPRSVVKYKRQQAAKAAGHKLRFAVRVEPILAWFGLALLVMAAGCGIACGITSACHCYYASTTLGYLAAIAGLTFVGTLLGMGIAIWTGYITPGPSPARDIWPVWKQQKIKHYDAPIPEYVLQTAVDIKRECPNARLRIDRLTVPKAPRLILDPFLVLQLPVADSDLQQDVYLEVWEEPDFKAERRDVDNVLS